MGNPEDSWFGWMHGKKFRLTRDYPHIKDEVFKNGDVVKAVMVSRMGDVGVTHDLTAENGYGLRVMPWQLEPLDTRPVTVCPLCNLELEAGEHGDKIERKCEKCHGETGPCDPVCPSCCFLGSGATT